MNSLEASIAEIERTVGPDPGRGLPDDVFLLLTRLTPMVNVDLMIKDSCGRTLLVWRDDEYCGAGWHVPGGIVRPKELLSDRITAVATNELGAAVRFNEVPIGLYQSIHPQRKNRGHFISLLFACQLTTVPDPSRLHAAGAPRAGQWAWHDRCPSKLIRAHEMYRSLIDEASDGGRQFHTAVFVDTGD